MHESDEDDDRFQRLHELFKEYRDRVTTRIDGYSRDVMDRVAHPEPERSPRLGDVVASVFIEASNMVWAALTGGQTDEGDDD